MNKIFQDIEGFMKVLSLAVKTAEQETQDGETKRQNAINMIIGFFKLVGLDLTPYEKLIGQAVDTLVFLYNLYGVFTHSTHKTNG